MISTSHRTLTALVAGSLAVAALAGATSHLTTSGPPTICSEIKIGEAKTLPATDDAAARTLKRQLVRETLALLGAETPVLVRMETLRRALIIAADDNALLYELSCSLQARVLDEEARGKEEALAWFDAGYMAASWSQLDRQDSPEIGLAEGCVGYAWMRKALALGKDQPEMEFAAALATHPAMHKGTYDIYKRHLARAASGAVKDSLLEQNLKVHCASWNESYDDMKQKGGPERGAGRNR